MKTIDKIEQYLSETTVTFDELEVRAIEDRVRNKIFPISTYLRKAMKNNGQLSMEVLQRCISALDELDKWVSDVKASHKYEL